MTKLQDIVVVLLPAGLLRLHRHAHADRAGERRRQRGCICGSIILALATLGKFGGSALAARVSPACRWRDAASLGILMNTRGLMELIVLNIGLDLEVISPTLFAMLVIMALVTTVATTPVLDWIRSRGRATA